MTPAKENSRFFFIASRDGLLLKASSSRTRLPCSSSRRRRPVGSHGAIQTQSSRILYTAKMPLEVLGSGSQLSNVSLGFQLFLHRDKRNMVKFSKRNITCLVICIFIIKIKQNNVHNKHDKQHNRDFHAIHHNFVSIIKIKNK